MHLFLNYWEKLGTQRKTIFERKKAGKSVTISSIIYYRCLESLCNGCKFEIFDIKSLYIGTKNDSERRRSVSL